ncbi:hypothetical protein BREVNS_0878 [Brevinematales bacterium NS]|nr:hypothetical protein BREVNS_0878 [Brevinematales bacterium NS]
MRKNSSFVAVVLGVLLVLMGVAFLLGSWIPGLSGFSLWPLFLLLPVVSMLLGVQSRKDLAKVIFWVTYLTYLVVFFLVLNFIGWETMERLWPHFIIAAAASFLSEFFVTLETNKLWETLIAALIGAYFLIPGLPFQILGGVLLILWGGKLLIQSLFFSVKKKE